MSDIVKGTVENIIYQNTLNGYTVFSVIPFEDDLIAISADGFSEITCTANMPQVNVGEHVSLTGSFVFHPSYGRQFQVEFYEKELPTDTTSIERYLGSGLIKGVGEATAKRIVKKFGKETISVIENTPERLAEIRGISVEKALSVGAVFAEQTTQRNAMMFLQSYGISTTFAIKIYKKYKERTADVVKENPYALAEDIIGIGFKTADAIAARVGIAPDSPFRVKAGVVYVLTQNAANGSVYLPKERLTGIVGELLEVDGQLVENCLIQLQFERVVWQERLSLAAGECVAVYLNPYYYAESYVAKKLLELAAHNTDNSQYVDNRIADIERGEGVELAKNQKQAVKAATSSGVLVITGGPGTGKTTTIKTIIKLMEQDGIKIELTAPTGRAAKRMTEATGRDAKTIHRLLGIGFSDSGEGRAQSYERNEDKPLECGALIVDESSMVDILLMNSLLKAVEYGTKLILVGDVDQLPSVGPGSVLRDIIASAKITVVRLTEIFRQAQESAIVMNAHRINNGRYPEINSKNSDFFFVKRPDIDGVVSTIVELAAKRLPQYAKCGTADIQVLTPMRKGPLGAFALNGVLQAALNPPSSNKRQKELRTFTLREGDKVMQIKNNYNLVWKVLNERGGLLDEGTGVFNGDEGVVSRIDDAEEKLTVLYDDRTVIYDYSQLDEIDLSYAVTIHKSQGSEYRAVIIPLHSGPPLLMSRNLLYTAVTRAKELAVIVGQTGTMNRMVDNNNEVARFSSLAYRLERVPIAWEG